MKLISRRTTDNYINFAEIIVYAENNNTESSDFFEGLGNCVRESDGVQADIGLYTTD